MNQPYTSQGIVDANPVDKPILVYFSPASAAYQQFGEYVVGWRLEQEGGGSTDSDFPIQIKILSKANALPEVGSQYEADIPHLSNGSFRGSEVILIRKYG
jgi:hypothetical protein